MNIKKNNLFIFLHSNFSECKQDCVNVDAPLCGSNKITYKNFCELHNAYCTDPTLKIAHEGPCGKTKNNIYKCKLLINVIYWLIDVLLVDELRLCNDGL